MPLEKGDRIIAVDGFPVNRSHEILSSLQQHHVNIIVERELEASHPSWVEADSLFDQQYQANDLIHLVSQIGTTSSNRSFGNLVLLNPVIPKMLKDFQISSESFERLQDQILEQIRRIESIEDPDERAQAWHKQENRERQLLLGLPMMQDQIVHYNPDPFCLFEKVFEEIWHTLKALFTGSLNPKWMTGPIGIVQVVHTHSMISLKEAVFWLGAISLNLGVLNLLPLPVLDGGSICFALYEMITGKRLKAKTLEKLMIPFALLLIGFLFS